MGSVNAIRWLRLSYWVGAILDGVVGVLMFFPRVGRSLYGVDDFTPTPDYRYAMRFGASLMLGWAVLLLWADRKPLERRGILPITVLVLAGLAWAGAYAVGAGLIARANMVPSWGLQAVLVGLFSFSYLRSIEAARGAKTQPGATSLGEAAAAFLAQRRFAVAGVSREGNAAANFVFRRLRESGRDTAAINPNAATVDGEPCYASIADLPDSPDAVVVMTHPREALELARQCRLAAVPHVWFHRSIDGGSFSAEAVQLCKDYGATVIPGGCPMMHLEPVDFGHRCMRRFLRLTGSLPATVSPPRPRDPGAS